MTDTLNITALGNTIFKAFVEQNELPTNVDCISHENNIIRVTIESIADRDLRDIVVHDICGNSKLGFARNGPYHDVLVLGPIRIGQKSQFYVNVQYLRDSQLRFTER